MDAIGKRKRSKAKMARKKAYSSGCPDYADMFRTYVASKAGAKRTAALYHIVEGPPPLLIDAIYQVFSLTLCLCIHNGERYWISSDSRSIRCSVVVPLSIAQQRDTSDIFDATRVHHGDFRLNISPDVLDRHNKDKFRLCIDKCLHIFSAVYTHTNTLGHALYTAKSFNVSRIVTEPWRKC